MTTWTIFETIDGSPRHHEVFIDRLGVHGYTKDERTRFELRRVLNDEGVMEWQVFDLEPEFDQKTWHQGTMRECVQWIAGRVLYGA